MRVGTLELETKVSLDEVIQMLQDGVLNNRPKNWTRIQVVTDAFSAI